MAKRPKQEEMGMAGPGVAPVKHKDLDALGDKFIETRDEKAALATKLTELTTKIVDAMKKHGIEKYAFGDQEIIVKQGKVSVKVKTVKVSEPEADEE